MSAPWSENLDLLIRLIRPDQAGAAQCLQRRTAPADAFFEFAEAHKLAVVVRNALGGSALRNEFSAQALASLEETCAARTRRAGELLAELEQLAERFRRAGQSFALLKGPYLARRFYGDELGREFVDLDVLVPRADRARAFALLAAAGYSPKSRTLVGLDLTCFFVHGFDFANGRGKVDLHWALSRHPSFRIDDQALWATRRAYALNGVSYDVLSDEYEIVLAIVSLLRDIERGGGKLKNLVDLLRMLIAVDAEQDWDAFFAARRREHVLRPAVSVLSVCLRIADAADMLPNLQSALNQFAPDGVPARLTPDLFVFAPVRFGLGNKIWSARVHEGSPAAWLLWWAASLPFRIAVRNRRGNGPARPANGSVAVSASAGKAHGGERS